MLVEKKTPQTLHVARTPEALAQQVQAWRADGKRIAMVPTMGALHAGHASLMRQAAREADHVIVSIFVNPTQFGPNEDFAQYPRPESDDLALLEQEGVALAYLPTVEAMYPVGAQTTIRIGEIAETLCGAARPGHFDGVGTIVTKLLLQAMPDVAIFGEKDYQQLQIIRRMVEDLSIPVQVRAGATMREADGLALSSRNRYLSETQRQVAAQLFATLHQAAEKARQGEAPAAISAWGAQQLLSAGFNKVEYFELRDARTLHPMLHPVLHPVTELTMPTRLLAAAFLGKTRLIDNIAVER